MAFPMINEDQKQHLNLSQQAWTILAQDRAAFGGDNLTGFLNHILLCYIPEAEASISRLHRQRLEQYRQSLAALPEPHRETAARLLADSDADALCRRVSAYHKGQSVKFRLNNALFARLTDPDACSEETWYDGHIGRYLKALLEEYARLPYLRREEIYFAQRFSTIRLCIDGGRKLRIKVSGGAEYTVRPYEILTDLQSSYHYLVAWSDADGKAWPFRICSMRDVTATEQNGRLSAEKRKAIQQTLQEKDVPYIAEEIQPVRIRLTENGKAKYQTMLLQRPQFTAIENGDIYCFHCTLRQAEYYFVKFGRDAQVLSPPPLAERMRAWHRQALENYL